MALSNVGKTDLQTCTGDFFFIFIFHYSSFCLGIVKYIMEEILLISGFPYRQGGSLQITGLLPPPRRSWLPAVIDEPPAQVPCSFQSQAFLYFSFCEQCLFLVRKCTGRIFLDMKCAFSWNSFISDTCLWGRNIDCHFNINIQNVEAQQCASS